MQRQPRTLEHEEFAGLEEGSSTLLGHAHLKENDRLIDQAFRLPHDRISSG